MTEQAAQSWLSSHQTLIPALDIHHYQALETLEDHTKTFNDLADIIALDPGMSISLYQQVNAKLAQSGKDAVDSIHAALSLLGDGAIADLIMQHRVLEAEEPDIALQQSYHQLISRSYHLLAQLDSFSSIQGISAVKEIRSAALLHNVGEYLTCLFDHKQYQKYQVNFRIMGSEANSAKPVFGFDFHELGRLFAKQMYLPPLVVESLQEGIPEGRKARLIQLAADVSHQAEEGWYHSAMKATTEVCAAFLNQSLDGFDKHLQQVAIEAARNCPLDDVLAAASRLIMLPDVEPPAKRIGDEDSSFEQKVKNLLNSSQPNQVGLIDLMMTHLHEDLHMSRVVLLLLSADKRVMGTRAGRGFAQDSPITTLVVDMTKAGLLKQLMAKPQGLWVQSENFSKYEAALPANFKSSILHENFFLMSLFIDGNPSGVVFCDRAHSVNKLDRPSYEEFKASVQRISLALTQVAQQRRRQTTH